MSNDSPPGSEFKWPPTSDELDAIEVIKLDDASSVRQLASVPKAVVATPASGRRRWAWNAPRRDDLIFAGVTITSVMAIGTAAFMMFSDPTGSRDIPIDPLAAAATPAPATAPSGEAAPLTAALPLPATFAPAMSPIAAAPMAAALDTKTSTTRQRNAARATALHRAKAARARHHSRGLASRTVASRNLASRDVERRDVERRRVTPALISEDYSRPRLISPERGRKGKVVLLVEVRKNGKVGDVDVISSDLDRDNRSHRDLQRAAISTVKRWRYEPAIRDGAPADSQIRVVVNIDLDSARMIGPATAAGGRRRAAAADREADTVLAVR